MKNPELKSIANSQSDFIPPTLLEKVKEDIRDVLILQQNEFVRCDVGNNYNLTCVHADGTRFASNMSDKMTPEKYHRVALLKAIREHEKRKSEKTNEVR
jgi:hypothetical protein